VPAGFQQVPIYTFISDLNRSHINTHGCHYANQAQTLLQERESQFKDHLYLIENLRAPISKCFHLSKEKSEDMTFHDLVLYTDTLSGRRFEGLTSDCHFTEKQWMEVESVNKIYMLGRISTKA
jgi:hypothetical protein